MADLVSASTGIEALLVHIADRGSALKVAETVLQKDDVLTIGRQAGEVDLLLNERSVSRRHAQIRTMSGHYLLFDLGSQNGTFVNDELMEPEQIHELKHNDILRFGKAIKFRFLKRTQTIPQQTHAVDRQKSDIARRQMGRDDDKTSTRISTVQPVVPQKEILNKELMQTLRESAALVILADGEDGNVRQAPEIHFLNGEASITLGRSKGNDIELADSHASRRHAEILPRDDGYYIRDLESRYGIEINQSLLEGTYKLAHGDRIVLGETIIFFVDLQAGREPTMKLQVLGDRKAQRPLITTLETGEAQRNKKLVDHEKKATQVLLCPHCGVANLTIARFCAGCSRTLRSKVPR